MSARLMHYKDTSPKETIVKLKNILKELNLDVEEKFCKQSSIGTYSVRVCIKGTEIGSNGKGVSELYALASAYAEFLERLENGLLGLEYKIAEKLPYYKFADEKLLSAREIISGNGSFIKFYLKQMNFDEQCIDLNEKKYLEINQIDNVILGEKDKYITLPFYNIKSKTIEYLPYYIYNIMYTSNGMCAGNTREEALVQGMSEIIERYVQKRLFIEKPTLPDIPEEYLAQYPYISDLYFNAKKIPGHKIMLKDCSLGGEFPVAALVIIEENTGRYGIKLGCHPDYGVAIERAFTEATQGGDLCDYVTRSLLDFDNRNVTSEHNIFNSFKIGQAQYPYQLFGKEYSYEFRQTRDVSNMTNKEILQVWLQRFVKKGYDVLIRDVSYLDFPAFHIIIPGISEVQNISLKETRAANTRFYVRRLLEQSEDISKEDCKYIIATLAYYLDSILENSVKLFYKDLGIRIEDIPCENINASSEYMISMCNFVIGRYKEASEYMNRVILQAKRYNVEKNEMSYFEAIKGYFEARYVFNKHINCIRYLEHFYDNSIIDKIDYYFCETEKVLNKQYPKPSKAINKALRIKHNGLWEKLFELQSKTLVNQNSLNDLWEEKNE